MRNLAAEQQALRIQREQLNTLPSQAQLQFKPSEVQQFAAAGLVGSKRLAENLEGMLRDKPKFNFFEATASAEPELAPSTVPESNNSAEPVSFVPGEIPLDLPLLDRRPRRAAEDPASQDLNLSSQNRQQALTQGIPASQTARAAAEIFRPQAETPPPAESQTAEDASSGTSSSSSASTPAVATAAADDGGIASRGTLNYDRGRISTASDSLGETRGITDNQLVLHDDDPEQSDLTVRQELGRQSAVEDESKRRGDAAQTSLETSRGREGQLNAQKDQLESAKGQQRAASAESSGLMQRDNQLLEQQTQSIAATQKAGESSLARITQLDTQVQDNARVRDQSASDLSSSQQSVSQLQSQVSSLQSAPTPTAPGNANSNGKGNQAKQETANAAAAQQQQAVTSAQSQLAAAQKEQEAAQKRQQDAEAAIQTGQAAAQAERSSLEQSRSSLNAQQESRKITQDRARAHSVAAQEDQDRLKDLTSHSQDLKGQFDEVAAARDQALTSLQKNRRNAAAARENVEQLRSLQTDLSESKPTQTSENPDSQQHQVGEKAQSPNVSEARDSTLPASSSAEMRSQSGSGPTVRKSGKDTVVQLNSLNQGSDSLSKDNLSGVSKNRSGASEGGDLGEASLAAAAAANSPKETASSGESIGADSGGPGKGNSGGGPPGHSGERGNGKSNGKGPS